MDQDSIMTAAARDKLKETKFFLEKLRRAEDDEFKYYFSAFLSAGRSVTFFLQAENSGDNDFNAWYGHDDMSEAEREGTRRHQLKNDPLIRILKEIRDISIHARRPDRSKSATVVLEEGPSGSTSKIEENYYLDDIPEVPNGIQDDFWDEYSDTPIIELCEGYVEELEDLLSEWEE